MNVPAILASPKNGLFRHFSRLFPFLHRLWKKFGNCFPGGYSYLNKFSMEQNHFWIKDGPWLHKVAVESILFVRVYNRGCEIYTNETLYRINCSLRQLLNKRAGSFFTKVHRSYAVNLQNVTGMSRTEIFIGDHCLPVSRDYARKLFGRFKIFTSWSAVVLWFQEQYHRTATRPGGRSSPALPSGLFVPLTSGKNPFQIRKPWKGRGKAVKKPWICPDEVRRKRKSSPAEAWSKPN